MRSDFPSKAEIEYFLGFLDQFEHGTLKDNIGIQNAFVDMINSFIDQNPERRTFVTFNNQTDYDAKSIKPQNMRIPYGLLYEISKDTFVEAFSYEKFLVRRPNLILDERTKTLLQRYETLGLERIGFLYKRGRREEAKQTLEWVLKNFPNSQLAQNFNRLLNE